MVSPGRAFSAAALASVSSSCTRRRSYLYLDYIAAHGVQFLDQPVTEVYGDGIETEY